MAVERLPLTISQKWLMIEMERFKYRGWETIEFLARTKAPINVPALREALYFLVDKYENLRVKIFQDRGQWIQEVYPLSEADPFSEYDHSDMDNERRKREMRRICIRERNGLIPERGNLLRVVFFKTSENEGRFWFCLHHVIADFAGASSLVGEIMTVYKDILAGKKLKWAATKEYRKWLYTLEGYCRDILLPNELDFWESFAWDKMGIIPSDFPEKYNDEKAIADAYFNKTIIEGFIEIGYLMSPANTMALFNAVGGGLEDYLTAIFFLAVAKTKHMDWIGIGVSNSGRTVLPPEYGVDEGKLFGYLTVYRMLLLKKPPESDLAGELDGIMEQMREAPRKGIGIGFLKEHVRNTHLRKSYFNFLQRGVIHLNYVGRIDVDTVDADLFEPLWEDTGMGGRHQEWQNALLGCRVGVKNNHLSIGISYNQNYFMDETIEEILDFMKAMLKEGQLSEVVG